MKLLLRVKNQMLLQPRKRLADGSFLARISPDASCRRRDCQGLDVRVMESDPRRAEKPAHLRSETPEGVRQELSALSLGHFVVRALDV